MTTKELYDMADRNDCRIEWFPLEENEEFCIEEDGRKYVCLDTRLTECEENVRLGHGLGHLLYAGTYTQKTPLETLGRIESSARKWTCTRLIPIGKLREALRDPFLRSFEELAEYFNVTPELVSQAVTYYTEEVGLSFT